MAPARRSAAQPTEPKKPIPGPIDANHAAPARDRSGAGAGPSGGADVSAMTADELAWKIAAHRATVFPGWFVPLHAAALRATGSGRGWHGTIGRSAVAFAVVFEIVSALLTLLYLGVAAWAAYTVILVMAWKRLFARSENGGRILPPGVSAAPAQPQAASAATLNVLNFNLFQRSPGSPGGADGFLSEEYKDQRLDEFCARLAQPELRDLDVLCCQELYSFGQWRQEKLLAHAAKLGFTHYACSSTVALRGGWGPALGAWAVSALAWAPNLVHWIDGGIMIVSKHPITESRTAVFTASAGGDMFAAKGPVYTQLAHPMLGPVHVFSFHLQASENLRNKDAATAAEQAIRTAQVDELLGFIRASVPGDVEDATVLVAGDWNIDAHAHRFEEKMLPNGLQTKPGDEDRHSPPRKGQKGSVAIAPPSAPPGGSPEYRALLAQIRTALP